MTCSILTQSSSLLGFTFNPNPLFPHFRTLKYETLQNFGNITFLDSIPKNSTPTFFRPSAIYILDDSRNNNFPKGGKRFYFEWAPRKRDVQLSQGHGPIRRLCIWRLHEGGLNYLQIAYLYSLKTKTDTLGFICLLSLLNPLTTV